MTEFQSIVRIGAGGLPVANSVDVARVLGRAHKNILKSLRRLKERNPRLGIHPATPPKGHRTAYDMTVDGFAALTATIPNVEEEMRTVFGQFSEVSAPENAQIGTETATEGANSAFLGTDGGITPPEDENAEKRGKTREERETGGSLAVVPDNTPANLELSPDTALPITVHPDLNHVVDARQLWEFINGETDFTIWFKRRCDRCDLAEGLDYTQQTIISNKTDEKSGHPAIGRPRVEYALTIDAAKEICMVEGGERGKQARRYFIECEKRFRKMQMAPSFTPMIPHTFAEALRLAADQQEKLEEQQRMLTEQRARIDVQSKALTEIQAIVEANAPKVAFANKVQESRAITVRTFAHILSSKGINIGEIRLFAWLRESGYLCGNNEPTQAAIEMGLFDMVAKTVDLPNGNVKNYTQTLITGKGQVYFMNRLEYDRAKQNADEQG